MRIQSLIAAVLLSTSPGYAEKVTAYFGTYTHESPSEGIYRADFDTETGEIGEPVLAVKLANPSFLEISPDGQFVYAAGEGGSDMGVSSFSIGADGGLTKINTQPSGGNGPCHLSITPDGKAVLVANYGSGSIALLPIAADGSLEAPSATIQHEGSSVNEKRQKGPHAHSINPSPDGRFAFAADLGIDKIMIYKMDSEAGTLEPNDPPSVALAPGAGPRHFSFHPSGESAYVINEMTRTVTAFDYDAGDGTLTETQTISTVPEGHEGGSTAEIRVHPGGDFVYGSNRGHDSIAAFKLGEDGMLSLVEIEPTGGQTPRNFNIAPGGKFLLAANQGSSDVFVHAIDPNSGALTPTGKSISIGKPVCVRFRPATSPATLFDGTSLDGWEGDETFFRIEDGAIVAGFPDKKIPQNEFLVSEEEFGDFDLEFEAKLTGQGKNAGVQFWSQRIEGDREMIGFQCDIGNGGSWGMIWGALYDESRRRKMLATPAQDGAAAKSLQVGGWNHLRVRAEGDRIQIWLNGFPAIDYTEAQDDIPRTGRIGLQIHSGPPAECRYRNLRLRRL